ncbi:hypothetical protein NPIL_503751 [Nephila pilipes]|uniref:Uncharacterized protein n=1 Tax=Nephila pilipes TaxID=299642 RepID=A0A8X6MS66_NEPPI|nr:hypothetical protein NPIL_503751 [Nephila pilipes]
MIPMLNLLAPVAVVTRTVNFQKDMLEKCIHSRALGKKLHYDIALNRKKNMRTADSSQSAFFRDSPTRNGRSLVTIATVLRKLNGEICSRERETYDTTHKSC